MQRSKIAALVFVAGHAVATLACTSSAPMRDDDAPAARARGAGAAASPIESIAASDDAKTALGMDHWEVYRGQRITYLAAMRSNGVASRYAQIATIASSSASTADAALRQVELRFAARATDKPGRVVFVNGGGMVADFASEDEITFAKHAAHDLASAPTHVAAPNLAACAAPLVPRLKGSLAPMFACTAEIARSTLRMSVRTPACTSAEATFSTIDDGLLACAPSSNTSTSSVHFATTLPSRGVIAPLACASCSGDAVDVMAQPKDDGFTFVQSATPVQAAATTGVEAAAKPPPQPDMCSSSEWITSVAGTFTGVFYCVQDASIIFGGCVIAGSLTLEATCAAAIGVVLYEELLPSPVPSCKDLPKNLHSAIGLACAQQQVQERVSAAAAEYDRFLNGCERSDAVCLNNWCLREAGRTGKTPDGCASIQCLAAAQARLPDETIQRMCRAQQACVETPGTATGCGSLFGEPTLSKTDCGDKTDGWWCLDAGSGPGWMAYCQDKQVAGGCGCAGCATAGVKATCAASPPPAMCPNET